MESHPDPPATPSSPRLRARVTAWIRLPHPAAIVIVLAATVAFAMLFSGGDLRPDVLVRMLLAMLGGQLAIGAVNEIADRALDARSKPWKPIPSGLVSVQQAAVLAVAGLVGMALAGSTFGAGPLALLALGTGLGLAYDVWLKPGPWAWAPYALALPLLPVWVMACLGEVDMRAWLLFPLGVPGTAGVYLAQSAADADTDRAAGLDNIGARLGPRRTALLATGLVGATILAALGAAWLTPVAGASLATLAPWSILAMLLVVSAAALAARGSDAAIRRCFVPLALALAVVGFGWAQAVG